MSVTVQGTSKKPDLTAWQGVTVTLSLEAGSAAGGHNSSGNYHIADVAVTTSDSSGNYSFTVDYNDALTPANTYYVVREKETGARFAFRVVTADGVGPLRIENLADSFTPPAALDAGSIPKSTGTTKGDMLVFNGTDWVRLPVGTNGQVIAADSAQTSGVKWSSAVGGGTVTSVTAGDTTVTVGGTATDPTVAVATGAAAFVEAIQDIVGALVVDSATINFTYDDTANTLTGVVQGLTSASLSDFAEAVQDTVGAMATDSSTVNFTYDDVAGTLTAVVQGLDHTSISDFNEAVDDRVAALAVAGANLSITYNDPANTLTFAVTGLAAVATSGAYGDLSGTPTLGTAAALNVPAAGNAAAGEVVKGSDTRLTDARTPTAHHTTHEPGGTDAMAVDAAAATGSLRTLGTGAQQAAAGNDSRLSDSRTPTGSAGGDLTGTYPNPTLAVDRVKTKAGGREDLVSGGNSGTAATISLANGNVVTYTLTGNCTFTFPTPSNDGAYSFTLVLTQDATGSRAVTWPAAVKWPGGTAPTLTTTASKRDVFTFVTYDGGTTWLGFTSGQNYA